MNVQTNLCSVKIFVTVLSSKKSELYNDGWKLTIWAYQIISSSYWSPQTEVIEHNVKNSGQNNVWVIWAHIVCKNFKHTYKWSQICKCPLNSRWISTFRHYHDFQSNAFKQVSKFIYSRKKNLFLNFLNNRSRLMINVACVSHALHHVIIKPNTTMNETMKREKVKKYEINSKTT